MTAVPLPPAHLFTVGEYAALGEEEHGRWELVEGNLMMSPSPTPQHNLAVARMIVQLTPQLPTDLEVVPDVDVDLELAASGQPGFVRRPDLVAVESAAIQRAAAEDRLLHASEVRLVIEVVSPGSRRIDNLVKRAEYADAGIAHYWIVDLDQPVSVLPCHLTKKFGYAQLDAVTGTFSSAEPFPVALDLDRLR